MATAVVEPIIQSLEIIGGVVPTTPTGGPPGGPTSLSSNKIELPAIIVINATAKSINKNKEILFDINNATIKGKGQPEQQILSFDQTNIKVYKDKTIKDFQHIITPEYYIKDLGSIVDLYSRANNNIQLLRTNFSTFFPTTTRDKSKAKYGDAGLQDAVIEIRHYFSYHPTKTINSKYFPDMFRKSVLYYLQQIQQRKETSPDDKTQIENLITKYNIANGKPDYYGNPYDIELNDATVFNRWLEAMNEIVNFIDNKVEQIKTKRGGQRKRSTTRSARRPRRKYTRKLKQ
jgi:hypothetical protein